MMQQFYAFGLSLGAFDMTKPHENGFAVTCAGMDTVYAHVDIPAGARGGNMSHFLDPHAVASHILPLFSQSLYCFTREGTT